MTTWVRFRPELSFHLLKVTRSLTPETRCGREIPDGAERSEDLPGGKSCETCARLLIWDQERAGRG